MFITIHFKNIEEMLLKLYYLHQKSPKCFRELRELSEAYDKSLPKPTRCNGTRWIDHKYKALEVLYDNYGIFIAHLEWLVQAHSQVLKWAEIEGFTKKMEVCKLYHSQSYLLRYSKPITRASSSTTARNSWPSKGCLSYSGLHFDNGKTKINNCWKSWQS